MADFTLPDNVPLGKQVAASDTYDKSLLVPIARKLTRDNLGIGEQLPFVGEDIWQAFELSWLNAKGKPCVAVAKFYIPCSSWAIVESKSFKLYLNSFNQTRFDDRQALQRCLEADLSELLKTPILIELSELDAATGFVPQTLPGVKLDDLDIEIKDYQVNAELLLVDLHEGGEEAQESKEERKEVSEVVYSHLLRSLCPVTGQPDWGSVLIEYTGPKINHQALLAYIISFRQHQEFHEQCIERLFIDLMRYAKCKQLTIQGFYVRRGGLDINPMRSSHQDKARAIRLLRQ